MLVVNEDVKSSEQFVVCRVLVSPGHPGYLDAIISQTGQPRTSS